MTKSGKVVSGSEVFQDIWEALESDPREAANLRIRSTLMTRIETIIEKNGWTQAEAARHCRVTQPRINELLRGRISRFSLDALVNIAASLGQEVRIDIKAA
jgi:predicted XRE-type DNA-binding protein